MLVIPPGWNIVSKSKNPYSRIQAKCLDSKGRWQYIYHPLWSVLTTALKYKKLVKICKAMRKITRLTKAKKCDDLDNLIKIMIFTNIRLGSDKYAEDNDSFGICTLQTKHVTTGNSGEILLSFLGKSGHKHDVILQKGPEHKFIKDKARQTKSAGGKRLFPPGTAERLRVRFKEMVGDDFNPKDIRTYKANLNLVTYLRRCAGVNLEKELRECIKRTATNLHHTPGVCKSNYLCPQIMDLWLRNPGAIKEGAGINLYKLVKGLSI